MATRIMNNQENMKPPKKTNKAPMSDSTEVDLYERCDKAFKTIILKD